MRQHTTLRPEGRRRAGALFAALILPLCAPGLARAAATESANKFLIELTDRALVQLTETGLAEVEQRKRFRGLFNEAFDLPEIGRFVLGHYWRRPTRLSAAKFSAPSRHSISERRGPTEAIQISSAWRASCYS